MKTTTLTLLLAALSLTPQPRLDEPPARPEEPSGAGRLPFAFIENRGQWDAHARFRAITGPTTAWVGDDGWRLEVDDGARGAVVDMRFVGAAGPPRAVAGAPAPGTYNWFVGDSSDWVRDARGYERVRLIDTCEGVEVVLREQGGHFEYDLVLEAGARLHEVAVRCDGIDGLRLAADGSLVMDTAMGELRQKPPLTWTTDAAGIRHEVICRYVLRGERLFGFVADGWTGTDELTIDPGLVWATMLGGSSHDRATAVAVTTTGEVIIVGETTSTDFPPTPGAFDPTFNYTGGQGTGDGFVAKFTADGSALVFATYLGGNEGDEITDVHVDSLGRITVGGHTSSSTFPTTPNAYDRTPANSHRDCFVARLDASGSRLEYATYFGDKGAGEWDSLGGIAVDPIRDWIYLAGTAGGPNFPVTANAAQLTPDCCGSAEAFLSVLDLSSSPGTTVLQYSTYLGGGGSESISSAPDLDPRTGIVTLAGHTTATDFPTTLDAFMTMRAGNRSGFVCRIDPSRSGAAGLVWSTYVGGSAFESALVAKSDGNGIVTIAGQTTSSDLPTTASAAQAGYGGSGDAFVARLDPGQTGSAQLLYLTYLGGDRVELVGDLQIDQGGLATVVGRTDSPNTFTPFPTTAAAFQTRAHSSRCGFLTRIDPSQSGAQSLDYSTLVQGCGGSGDLRLDALALDASGQVATVAGSTKIVMSTPGAFQPSVAGGFDALVLQLELGPLPATVSAFGASCLGSVGVPALVPVLDPQLCQRYQIELRGARPSSSAFLLYSGSRTAYAGLALPLSLDFLGMIGCNLYVGPTVVVGFDTGSGTVRVGTVIPAVQGLIDTSFYNQVVFFDADANAFGVVTTNAIVATIRP